MGKPTEWQHFGQAIWSPLVILPLLGAIGFIVGQQALPANATGRGFVSALLSVLLTLSSGTTAAIFVARWLKQAEDTVITARARPAVRTLNDLQEGIHALESRARACREDLKKPRATTNTELARAYLREVEDTCSNLRRQALSSIANWQDILPEAAEIENAMSYEQEKEEVRKPEKEAKVTAGLSAGERMLVERQIIERILSGPAPISLHKLEGESLIRSAIHTALLSQPSGFIEDLCRGGFIRSDLELTDEGMRLFKKLTYLPRLSDTE